jgi:regulation of enolase protein 1 (concanavalin A-like superfamily)
MNIDFTTARWINKPKRFEVTRQQVKITTEPHTDFWQRTYYGFRNDNAPALLIESADNFTFTTRVTFEYQAMFDQCGLVIYLDRDNWFKVCLEYENEAFSRLGTVVTNGGHSDWATTDIPPASVMWYRLSRRGPDFLIESSADGVAFAQMRIFHLHRLGPTSPEMGKLDPPAPAAFPIQFGLFACSPTQSSFEAVFDHFKLEACSWLAHSTG